MALEEQGVPTVAVHTHVFARLAASVARANGMPTTRQAFVPQPVVGRSPGELRAYIEGDDPVNKRRFVQELIEGLTQPLEERDQTGLSFERTTPRLVEPDTEDNLHRIFLENHWTDFLPIVLPTEERVEAMLAGTKHAPDEVVGRLRPTAYRELWEFTVEKVAVNAVMAGARPEYLPVILAMASTGVSARSSSTTSFASPAMVNGPIRHELGMNYGIGAMGPYNHANATIGRAFSLLSQNLQGGSVPGDTYMGSQGNPLNFSMCFAENEEASPWEPFHVQHGFRLADSAVSVFGGCRSTAFTLGLRERHWREHVRHLLRGMDPHNPPTLLLDPITARQFIDRGGFDSKDKLIDWLYAQARLPAGEYWGYQLIQNYILPRATFGEEPYATMLRAAPEEPIPMFKRDDIHVVVVGGETNGYWRIMGCTYGKTVSVDDWR